jgi:peptide/nickel transport system substrate-binding protein
MLFIITAASPLPIFGQTQTPLYGGTLRVAYKEDPISFNTVLNYWTTTVFIADNVYDRLLTFDKNYQLVGDLAQSWESTPDGKTWTFHLYKNVTWHDGVPFTSADVKFHYELMIQQQSWDATYFSGLQSIDTPDNYTVIFRSSIPIPPTETFASCCGGDSLILPKHIYEGTNITSNPANWMPIGTGPFKVVEYVKDDHVTLVANDHYFKGRPYLDKVIFLIIPSQQTAELAFQNGQVDSIHESISLPIADIPTWEKTPGVTLNSKHSTGSWRLTFNFRPKAQEKFPWLKDVRVRQAIAYAIDKQSIINTVFGGLALSVDTAISPVIKWAYDPNAPTYPYNVTKANQLLDEAGYKRGSDGWRFHAPLPAYQRSSNFIEIIKSQLAAVGIDVTIQLIDDTTFYSLYETSATGAGDDIPFVIQTMGTGPEPSPALMAWLYSRPIGDSNTGFYSNPEVDRLLNESGATTDLNVRVQDYYKIQEIVNNDCGFVFLWNSPIVEVYKNEFVWGDTNLPAAWASNYRLVWWTKGQASTAAPMTETSETTMTTTPAPTGGYDMTTVAAAIFVLVVVLAGIGFYMSRRKKK